MKEENVKAEILDQDKTVTPAPVQDTPAAVPATEPAWATNREMDREEEEAPPREKNPGIIIEFIRLATGEKEIMCTHSDFKTICTQSGTNELTLKIEFQLKMKGVLQKNKFDPATTANPSGDNIIYVEFDDATQQMFKDKAINPIIKVTEGAAAGMNFTMGFPDIGKTRWGRP